MLTSRRAGARCTSWSAVHFGTTIILSVMTCRSAYAAEIHDTSCVSSWTDFNCVTRSGTAGDPNIRLVPEPLGEADKAHLAARDRKWMARCHPAVEHDRYGVARYHYSAPGCEFGVGED